MITASAVAAAWPSTSPNGSSSSFAIAGSPTAAMPIDASVMPTWLVAMYSSMRSICCSASAAPFAPSLVSDWMRSTRERTSAYSAATKKAFMSISAGTPTNRTISTVRSPARAQRASYFEGDLGRASASDVRLPEAPGGSERRVQPRRAVALVLPDGDDAAARARELRPPGVAAAHARVAQQTGPATLGSAAANGHRSHHAAARAGVLERDRRVAAAAQAERRRKGRDLLAAVRVDLAVLAAPAR